MTVITRSALVAWGRRDIPTNLCAIVDGKVVTWAEVLERRRRRQDARLASKRNCWPPSVRAYRIWVAYFDMNLMGGWHAFLEDFRGASHRIWVRNGNWLTSSIMMEAFPLLLPLGSEKEQWENWKVAFARTFQRRRQHGQPVGVAYCWWDGIDDMRPITGVAR